MNGGRGQFVAESCLAEQEGQEGQSLKEGQEGRSLKEGLRKGCSPKWLGVEAGSWGYKPAGCSSGVLHQVTSVLPCAARAVTPLPSVYWACVMSPKYAFS